MRRFELPLCFVIVGLVIGCDDEDSAPFCERLAIEAECRAAGFAHTAREWQLPEGRIVRLDTTDPPALNAMLRLEYCSDGDSGPEDSPVGHRTSCGSVGNGVFAVWTTSGETRITVACDGVDRPAYAVTRDSPSGQTYTNWEENYPGERPPPEESVCVNGYPWPSSVDAGTPSP